VRVSRLFQRNSHESLVTIGDKIERVRDLRIGDKLTFWVREGQFGVSPTLADQPMPIIKPEAMPTN
jgi:hypothetical protein